MDGPGALPYPHARNDCEICRERDADFHILGEAYNKPGKRPLLLCQACLGPWAVTQVYLMNEGQPAVITLEPAPGRDWRPPQPPPGGGESPARPPRRDGRQP
jgi:hypothetical protein